MIADAPLQAGGFGNFNPPLFTPPLTDHTSPPSALRARASRLVAVFLCLSIFGHFRQRIPWDRFTRRRYERRWLAFPATLVWLPPLRVRARNPIHRLTSTIA